jgi:hypothetical protein
MNQREIDRLAKWRAGLILQAVLSDGWRPDRLVEEYGEETTDKITEAIHRISVKLCGEATSAPRKP